MKALKPSAPPRTSERSTAASCALAGTSPAQKATLTEVVLGPAAAAALRASSAAVVVQGAELSGMSITVVTPPAAAARVAVVMPAGRRVQLDQLPQTSSTTRRSTRHCLLALGDHAALGSQALPPVSLPAQAAAVPRPHAHLPTPPCLARSCAHARR